MAQKTFADKAYVDAEVAKKADKSHGTHLTLGTGSGNAYRGDYGNTAYTHSQAAHAPSNAQKNSDITKAEIEAKLTGVISTHKHTLLESNDTRSKNELPSTYTNRGIVPEFKSSDTIGLPNVGKGFTGLITYQQWSDTTSWTGGKTTQFGTIDDGRMYYRKGDGSGWGSWYQFYTTQNKPTPADIGAAVASHGNHVPTTQAAQNTTFLRNDNTWYKLTLSDLGAAAASHGTHVTYGTTNPLVAGTASPGSANTVSRSDHVHPAQTTVSGNAGSATKLQTARNIVIGNKTNSFNGTANITYTLNDIGATETVAWDTSIKCATWSRLFQFASSNATTGGTFLVNIRATRSSVVYSPTLLVNFSHSSVCNIVQINNTSYSNIKVRGVVDSNGAGYFEIYDNINSATNSTTQTVSVTVTKISSGLTITKYTAFTDGTTIPTNYASKGEITTVSGAYYSGTAAKANTATSASSATKATQDSAGQQINTTYIKGLSVSGKTITYTKGDGTTGTITTQDTNTTYTADTGIKLNGTKFQHTNAVTAGTAQGDASKTLSWGGTFTIPTVTYDAQGHITAKGTTIMTMPSNPNTDTHHQAKNIVGASTTATANATSSNGSTYLNLIENGAVRSTHKISGSGATTVTSDSSGNITINSTNTTYSAATTSANGLMTSAMVTKLNGIAEGANKYTHPSYTAKSAGFYKVTVDSTGHVSATTAVAKSDIEGLLTGAITTHTHSYIPLAGNTGAYSITGNVEFASPANGTFRGVVGKCGINDYWRVGGNATADNAGFMEIATADDYSEPIYVRQYSGAYATLQRTATLLDASGNTSFPGSVTTGGKVKLQYNSTSESLDFIFI